MISYNYNVDLPFTGTKLFFREINTEDQLNLAKASVSFFGSGESSYEYFQYVKNLIRECVKNKEDFDKINIVEYVLFLIKLRSISVGNTIDFLLKSETDSKSKTKIQIDLKKYMLNLYNASNDFEKEENNIVSEKNLKVKINWPSLNSLEHFKKFIKKENEIELFSDSLCEFIEWIQIDNIQKLHFNTLSNEDKIKTFNYIPVSLKNKFETKIIDNCKKLFEYDLFEIPYFKNYKFNFYNLSFIDHIKMLFSYDVRSIYEELLYFASHHLSPSYVLGISNSERKIYMSIIEERNKKKDKSEPELPPNINDESGYSNDVKRLALEFGDTLS
jgi:hypothetical protein